MDSLCQFITTKYLLHQTARDFLLADAVSPMSNTLGSIWQYSITSEGAHKVLAETCLIYLNFFNEKGSLKEAKSEDRSEIQGEHEINSNAFLDYAAENWGMHSCEARITVGSDLTTLVLSICNPNSKVSAMWFKLYWNKLWRRSTEGFNCLLISSYFGIEAVVKIQLAFGAETEPKDRGYGRTPLSWAAENGHKSTVQLLLEKGAPFDSEDGDSRTPLSWAAENGHESIVRLLLEEGALFDLEDDYSRTPLSWAAENGHGSIVRLLLERGASFNSEDDGGYTPLLWAIEKGHESIVRLLLEKGASFDFEDVDSQITLSWAASNGHESIVKLLLEKGAELQR